MSRPLRRVRAIWLAPVLAFLALGAWAFASPVGGSPDDDYHLASTWCASANPGALCAETADPTVREVPAELLVASCFRAEPSASAACAVGGDPAATIETSRWNHSGEYPPVYYAVMGVFAGPNVEVSILTMRLVNALLAVALATAVVALLPPARRPAALWPWLVAMIPLGIYLIPSNNPSSWAVLGIATAFPALLGWFETTGRRKIALGAIFVVAVVMGAGARSDAAVYTGLAIFIALLIEFSRSRRFAYDAILPIAAGILCLLFILLGRQSGVALSGFDEVSTGAAGSALAASPASLFGSNLLHLPYLLAGVFGFWGLGWFEFTLPPVVGFGAIAAFLVFGAIAFTVLSRRKAIAICIVGFALAAVPLIVLQQGGDSVGVQVQPRYILPLVVLFVGVLALRGDGGRQVRLTRGLLILVGVGVGMANAAALLTTTRRYTEGVGGAGGPTWWWSGMPPALAVVALGAIAFAGVVWVLLREIDRTVRQSSAPAGLSPDGASVVGA